MEAKKNIKTGFTLIELILVVAIIAILATLTFLFITGTTAKSRDSQRIQEVKSISEALKLYYLDNEEFPSESEGYGGYLGQGGIIDTALEPYLSVVPEDPKHDASEFYYYYDPYHSCAGNGEIYATVTLYNFETDEYEDTFSNRIEFCPSGWGGEGGSVPDYVLILYPASY